MRAYIDRDVCSGWPWIFVPMSCIEVVRSRLPGPRDMMSSSTISRSRKFWNLLWHTCEAQVQGDYYGEEKSSTCSALIRGEMNAVDKNSGRITKILMPKVWNLPSSQIFCKSSLLRTGIDHPGNQMSNSGHYVPLWHETGPFEGQILPLGWSKEKWQGEIMRDEREI